MFWYWINISKCFDEGCFAYELLLNGELERLMRIFKILEKAISDLAIITAEVREKIHGVRENEAFKVEISEKGKRGKYRSEG